MGSSQSTPPAQAAPRPVAPVVPAHAPPPPAPAPAALPPPPSPESYNQFIKGFVAGALLANLNKKLLLGAMVGGFAGAYYQQEFGAPDVKTEVEKWKKIVLEAVQGGKK